MPLGSSLVASFGFALVVCCIIYWILKVSGKYKEGDGELKGPAPNGDFSKQSSSSGRSIKCSKCAQDNDPGVIRCLQCNSSLRPTTLAIFTLFGFIALAVYAYFSLKGLEESPLALILYLINISGILFLVGLGYGHYWAWIGIQVMGIINIVVYVILYYYIALKPAKFPDLKDEVSLIYTVVHVLIIAFFWIYIYRRKIRDFCSVGRSLAS